VSIKRFLPFILLCSTLTILPFIEEFLLFLGIEDDVQYEQPAKPVARRASTPVPSDASISPNYFRGSIRAINLPGIKGTKKLPGVYHLESRASVPEEYEWQCGLHMLYNMCKIERALGIYTISDDEFITECKRVPRVFEEAGSFPTDLKKIAVKTACYPLHIVQHDDYADRIDILYESEAEARFWSRIHARLNKPGIQCEHFGCLIYAEECHIFLISIVKMADGTKALYLFDNVNNDEPRQAQYQMYRHAKYIQDHIFG